jgi:hypothetical protein
MLIDHDILVGLGPFQFRRRHANLLHGYAFIKAQAAVGDALTARFFQFFTFIGNPLNSNNKYANL